MSNPPWSTSEEVEEKSKLGATKSDSPDKSKFRNDAVPPDAARVAIPIVVLGKNAELGKKVAMFLHPEYLVIHHATSSSDLMSTLPTLKDPRPVGVFIGRGFSAEEQEDVEKQVGQLDSTEATVKVVRSEPVDEQLLAKYSALPMTERPAHVSKALLDRANLVQLPPTAEAVSKNAV